MRTGAPVSTVGAMALTDPISIAFVRQVSAVPEGLAFLLTQCIANEEYGECGVFARLTEATDDPEVQRTIRKHRADELRHAGMLRACLSQVGTGPMPVPPHLDAVAAMDRAIGVASERALRSDRDIMDLYLALLVLEERAATQFPLFARAARGTPVGDAMDSIAKDEERHIRYCRAISRRFAHSPAVLKATLRELRHIEERTFREISRGNMVHLLESGWLRSSRLQRTAWCALAAALRVVPLPMPTSPAGD
jgi:hypothetical protein